MSEIFCRDATSPCIATIYGRQYVAVMVDSQRVRAALRQLRTDANLTPEEFADGAGVSRATIYRIEDLERVYAPRIETVSMLVESRDITLSQFFARIEALSPDNVSETLLPPALNPHDGNHGSSDPLRRLPLDDTNAIIARNTSAVARLVGAIEELGERLVGELRAGREQTSSSGVAASTRDARRRKTG